MENRKEKAVMRVFMICFYVFLAVSCLYFAVYQMAEPAVNMDGAGAQVLGGFESAAADGASFAVRAEKRYAFDENGLFEMHAVLPDGIRDECLCFMAFCDTEVYCGGALLYRYDTKEEVHVIGGSVKSPHHFVQLDPSCSGKTVSIVQKKGTASTCRAGEVIFGSRSDIYRLMFRKYGAAFVMGLMLLGISAVTLVFGLIMQRRTRQKAGIVTISIAILLTAGWIVTDSNYYPFAFGHNYIDGLMSYLLCILLPIPYLVYLDLLQNGRHRKVYLVMVGIVLATFVICTALHVTGILPFTETLTFIDIELVAAIAQIAVILLREMKEGYVRAYRYTAIGFVCLMACAFGEILFVLAPHMLNTGGMILLGLLLLLCFAVAQQMDDSRVMDMERRKALELSETKSAFLASMSHEIRTPINSILGMNEMILRENRDPKIQSYAGTIRRSGRMLVSLINDVLDYSRIEAGKLEIVQEEYRLAEVLADVAAVARERAEQKGLTFVLEVAEGLPSGMRSDEVRIKQVLLNLLSNAVKYTDGGTVTVSVGGEYLDDETFSLCFAVKDTGRGIRREDQAHLFEAFSRSDLKKNRSIEGTGLGLAIVKNILDAMGGTITVESVYLEGSVFTVTLPQKVTDHTRMPADLSSIPDDRPVYRGCSFTAPGASILAVDDNPPNLSIVSALLRDTRARVDPCTNGNAALGLCREHQYDLILLDHMMPEPDGIETLRLIRTDPASKNRDTAAVVLTANAVAGSRQKYLEAGFADYLAKPLDPAALEETVRKFLPPDKVREAADETVSGTEDGVLEFDASGPENGSGEELPDSVRSLPGLNPEEGLKHTGGSVSLLLEILRDIAEKGPETARELRESAQQRDYGRYRIAAHSVKGLMASVGAKEMSEKARRHEFAARDGDAAFIDSHCPAFAGEYEAFCAGILEALPDGDGKNL